MANSSIDENRKLNDEIDLESDDKHDRTASDLRRTINGPEWKVPTGKFQRIKNP